MPPVPAGGASLKEPRDTEEKGVFLGLE